MNILIGAAYVGAIGMCACAPPQTEVNFVAVPSEYPNSLHTTTASPETNKIEDPVGPMLYTQTTSYSLEMIADKFQLPIYVTHAGDSSGRLFVVEQRGVVWIVKDGKRQHTPFLDISSRVSRRSSEQGMLGMAFHPHYSENGYVFVHYTDSNGHTVVQRLDMSADTNRADLHNTATLLAHQQPYRNHNGGQITFGMDGYLYIGLGDGGLAGDPLDNGQNISTLLGAILRVDVDHPTIFMAAPDNPFLTNELAAPEIWVYGLRNPWRFSFDRLTGDLYIGDVGQDDWEEVDFQPAGSGGGENYGWGHMEGDHCYQENCDRSAYVAPIVEYHHSAGGCSVTGGYVYRGENLKGLQGVYLYGDYCSGSIWALRQTAAGEWESTTFMESGLKISSFGEDETGEVYVVDHGGRIFRLTDVLDE